MTASLAKYLSFAVGVHQYQASSLLCPHVKFRAFEDCVAVLPDIGRGRGIIIWPAQAHCFAQHTAMSRAKEHHFTVDFSNAKPIMVLLAIVGGGYSIPLSRGSASVTFGLVKGSYFSRQFMFRPMDNLLRRLDRIIVTKPPSSLAKLADNKKQSGYVKLASIIVLPTVAR